METEFEAPVLEIDPAATEELILSRGGVRVCEKFMRRYVYGIEPGPLIGMSGRPSRAPYSRQPLTDRKAAIDHHLADMNTQVTPIPIL